MYTDEPVTLSMIDLIMFIIYHNNSLSITVIQQDYLLRYLDITKNTIIKIILRLCFGLLLLL